MEQIILTEPITITKLVNGGQGLGRLSNQQVVFVWNSLPGEIVRARIYRTKRGFMEGIAEEFIVTSPDRLAPKDSAYLATSPWQILNKEAEEKAKIAILRELLEGSKIDFADIGFIQSDKQWHYRNKMEYTFVEEDEQLRLALYERGQHQKLSVSGSSIAMESINTASEEIVRVLNANGVKAKELKTLVLRSNREGDVVASIFIKRRKNKPLPIIQSLSGLSLYYSDPKTPLSRATELLYRQGEAVITDQIMGKQFSYDAESFFQVNIDPYTRVLEVIKEELNDNKLVDLYAGVGSIGLSVAKGPLDLIESHKHTALYAKNNVQLAQVTARVVIARVEEALSAIDSHSNIIVDPPRAGLHQKVTAQLLQNKPPKIIYLSCNPATLCRDLKWLTDDYNLKKLEIINFFPKTPHIETSAILDKK